METENDINKSIMKTTSLIHTHYPELSEYIIEMPVTIPDNANPVISTETLAGYRDSLKTLMIKYARNKPK